MAVVATLSKGYDLDYVWRQVGPAAGRSAADYYIQASESGGEPPGRWWGPGAEALGFTQGQLVEREPYDLLFGERKAPDGTQLGRLPRGGQEAADLFQLLLAAEPHATAERRRELLIEAATRARRSPLYFDLTISLSKSISIFHASLGENARLARLAGDPDGDAYWSGLLGEVDDMIWRAVHTGFEYFQREAGYTRTGSHAHRVDGRETGQWHEADLAVAHWLQHISRDGDMQLHIHSQIAHIARAAVDGKWRAPDSLGYNEHVGAVAAIVSQHLEEALTARFGVDWVARDDGHGFEIRGISGAMMRLFSTRRESITADLRGRAREFASRYGRQPSQRELAQLAQESNFATRAQSHASALDFDALHAKWADRLASRLGVPLASVAPSVWGEQWNVSRANGASGCDHGRRREPGRQELRHAALTALARAQRDKSAFTRADMIKHLGRVLPRTGRHPDAAARLLERLADLALAGEFEQVVCLDAPEPVLPPAELVRADGRSVYQRHGGVKYATTAQLQLEERLASQACADGAPFMTRERAASMLGASVTQLDAALTQDARGAGSGATRARLRVDQAAAVFAAVTNQRRVSVINASAGSGKTTVLARAAQAWRHQRMGRVIGITPSQSARNTLAAGVPESYNAAQFLGDLPDRPRARGRVAVRAGDLLLVDEASMISTPDLADIVGHAEQNGAKVIIVGDTGQLQAVENGGGMNLLADTLGYVQLAEPVRFTEEWERAASLRLRAGDTSVLADYDEHGRIIGGEPEQIMETAAKTYVALTLQGRDVLLMAADHARRRELSRRIRDDLVHLGLVSRGPTARFTNGSQASAGDLVICTRNDHTIEAGEAGRTLANGDLLRVEAITRCGLVVRRSLGADPDNGRPRWTERTFVYGDFADCELGYAVTDHVAQSRTVDTGLALITGTEDRPHAYVAMTRGWRRNIAFVVTVSPKIADPAPGPRGAPEIARYDRLQAFRAGHPPAEVAADEGTSAVGVLAEVMTRDGLELSALQTLERNLSNADHLAILNAIWISETAPAREQDYRDMLLAALPAEYGEDISPRARWLWRTLRAAELAGLDPRQVVGDAVAQRSLSDARDVAAVVDARIRQRIRGTVPRSADSWSAQVPQIDDPDRQAYVTRIAELMDERKVRIGEHAAEHRPDWAVRALGPVPVGSCDELDDWLQRASAIGAYRELYRLHHPTESIGPEPLRDSPDKRSAWYEAFAALGLAGDARVRTMTDGLLLDLRATYPVETAWAPPWVGHELRHVRRGADEARLATIRAQAEAAAAHRRGQGTVGTRHSELAASYQALAAAYDEREVAFAGVMADRRTWEQATAGRRRLAVAADAELRRRHPGQNFPPLRSAEPEPISDAQRADLTLQLEERNPPPEPWIQKLANDREVFADQLASSLERQRADLIPGDSSAAPWPGSWAEPAGQALLQPPRPQIPPSARVLERVAERDAELEAAR